MNKPQPVFKSNADTSRFFLKPLHLPCVSHSIHRLDPSIYSSTHPSIILFINHKTDGLSRLHVRTDGRDPPPPGHSITHRNTSFPPTPTADGLIPVSNTPKPTICRPAKDGPSAYQHREAVASLAVCVREGQSTKRSPQRAKCLPLVPGACQEG